MRQIVMCHTGKSSTCDVILMVFRLQRFCSLSRRFCMLLETVVSVFLVVHVCRTVDRVVGHPRPSLAGFGVPWMSLPGPTDVP